MLIISLLYVTITWKESKSINKLVLMLTLWLSLLGSTNIELYNININYVSSVNWILLLGLLSIILSNGNIYIMYSVLGGCIIVLSISKVIFIIGLEIQSFSIYIMISKWHKKSVIGLNYYLLGSLSSVIILFGIIENISVLLSLGVIFKLSIYPLSKFWVELYNKLTLSELIHVINIPKISLLLWLIQNKEIDNIWVWVIVVTSVISSLWGLYTSEVRKVITFSSINQLSLILLLLVIKEGKIIELYMFQYIITTIILLYWFKYNNIELLINIKNYNKLILILNLLSLISIPVTLGFWSKLYLLIQTINTINILLIILVLLTSMLTGYYYLKIMNWILIENKITWVINKESEGLISWTSVLTLITTVLMLDKGLVIHLVEWII